MNPIIMCTTTQVITVLDGVIHCLLGYLLSFGELPAKVNKARDLRVLQIGIRAKVIENQVKVIMSSATSAVTYTSVYTDSEPGRAFWGADDEEAHDPDYVPEPIYPEYIPLEDDHEFPAEEQPLPPALEEYEDDEIEDGPVDYPMDGEDDGDDDDDDSSRDDANDEDEDEEDEEHLDPADSTTVIPVDEPVFPPEGTEHVIPPPPLDTTMGQRLPSDTRLPISYHQAETLRIASTQALIDAVTAALPPPPLPPSLHIPPPVDRRDDIPESEQPPRKRLYLSTIDSREYFVSPAEAVPEIAPMTVGEVNTRVIELAELHERDTHDLYALLEDAQDRDNMDWWRRKAYASREAWAHSIGLSQATHQELQTHRDHVYAHETYLQAHQTQL
ncbi:hypothetical protein Tco_0568900 [Tanacetum coccineum]